MMFGMAIGMGAGLQALAGMFGGSLAVPRAPATSPPHVVVILDRFGNSWYREALLDSEGTELTRRVGAIPPGRITLVYSPFSLEEDRAELVETLRKALPGWTVSDRAADESRRDAVLRLPRHDPAVQSRIMACRNQMWNQLLNGHERFLMRVQRHLTALAEHWAKVGSDLAAARQEYHPAAARVPEDGRDP